MKNCSHLVPAFSTAFSTQITAAFTSNDYSTFFCCPLFLQSGNSFVGSSRRLRYSTGIVLRRRSEMRVSILNRLVIGFLSLMVFGVTQSGGVTTADGLPKDNTPIQPGDPTDLPPKDYWPGIRKRQSPFPAQHHLRRGIQDRVDSSRSVGTRQGLRNSKSVPVARINQSQPVRRRVDSLRSLNQKSHPLTRGSRSTRSREKSIGRPQLPIRPSPFDPTDPDPDSGFFWPWSKRVKLLADPSLRI